MTNLGCRLAQLSTSVVNTIPVLAVLTGMYRTGTYIDIEILTFRTSLNIGRTEHVLADFRQYQQVPGIQQVQKKSFFFSFLFLSLVIFKFL